LAAEVKGGDVRRWLLTAIVCAAAVAVSFAWLDVPLTLYFKKLGLISRSLGEGLGGGRLLWGEVVVLAGTALVRLVRGRISLFGKTLAIACLSSMCAYGLNDYVLKALFGVSGPPAILLGARHVFHIWSGFQGSSFPSGHMVMAAAFAGVFMRVYRISIWPLSALLLLAATLLVVGYWHFLSDVIAGAFLGVFAGALAEEIQSRKDSRYSQAG
jgi:membrane-associated phospholipid phosphatase